MTDMDEFAQTRGDDDLFDDEIVPVSVEEQTEVVIHEPEPVPQEEPVVEKQPPPRGDTPQRGRGKDRSRGRGQGRGKGGRGLQDSRWAEPERVESPRSNGPAQTPESDTSRKGEAAVPDKPHEEAQDQNEQEEQDKAGILIANGAEPQRVPAVKGDRSATGGVKKPKLTEEELTKRIAAAKENAAKKAAAHARAEADQASFLQREQVAAEKRREEIAHRRVMDNEREQNRQRKLKAQTGREWDSEKREEDYNPRGGGSQFRRGMHGGVSGYARRDFDGVDETPVGGETSPRGRGRGGRGGRGRGPSRGPRGDGTSSKEASRKKEAKAAPGFDSEADFPSLPAGKKPDEAPATAPTVTIDNERLASMEKIESSFSPMSGTWADQVEE